MDKEWHDLMKKFSIRKISAGFLFLILVTLIAGFSLSANAEEYIVPAESHSRQKDRYWTLKTEDKKWQIQPKRLLRQSEESFPLPVNQAIFL